jgi:hypothetical protein
MKTVNTVKNFPVYAGMQFNGNNNKIRKIGSKAIKFTYLLHNDGDKQLIKEETIKTVIY